jgi:hypothetical protein
VRKIAGLVGLILLLMGLSSIARQTAIAHGSTVQKLICKTVLKKLNGEKRKIKVCHVVKAARKPTVTATNTPTSTITVQSIAFYASGPGPQGPPTTTAAENFGTDTLGVEMYVIFSAWEGRHDVSFVFYRPDGVEVYRSDQSYYFTGGPRGGGVYIDVAGHVPQEYPGLWSGAVFADGNRLGTAHFTLFDATASTAAPTWTPVSTDTATTTPTVTSTPYVSSQSTSTPVAYYGNPAPAPVYCTPREGDGDNDDSGLPAASWDHDGCP